MPASKTDFIAQTTATRAITRLRPIVNSIQRLDRGLADQLRRAATSVVLNLAEGAHNAGGHRRSRYDSARGSANETRACLDIACAWGYISEESAREVDTLYDEVSAMTYKLWMNA